MAAVAIDPFRMIKTNLAQQSRQFEQNMLRHAGKLVAVHFKRKQTTNEDAWRDPDLLWPNYKQD